ncbi:MAG: D-alanyl-D-alanine carboxypeptidase/D-alanyl-D-alanine-endopeptidase [Chitinophagaceae bacterium]|nr:D-alanyl-D-alanine carboxypeptidase/D-alanyl-D-alanine-endopeptidase [Chitinophagaceae bacterium]
MKKKLLLASIIFLFATSLSLGQTITQKITSAYKQFESDSQLRHAIASLYVVNARTGTVIFDKNSRVGLAPASTQKIITSVTAFELLGSAYRYETRFHQLGSGLFVMGSYDPTLGSWRYGNTRDTNFFDALTRGLRRKGVAKISSISFAREGLKNIPSGWIFEDIGNYYGAAPLKFNWRENQQDIHFIPGDKVGDAAKIDTALTSGWADFVNECTTGPKGSGDNAYVYFIPGSTKLLIQGTIPAGVRRFSISSVVVNPACRFTDEFGAYYRLLNFQDEKFDCESAMSVTAPSTEPAYIHYSPTMDSIIYWFNRKSINLYGEALLRTMGYERKGDHHTDSGVIVVQDFWKNKNVHPDELNMRDGSGLSPLNRVTTHAQVEILKYARSRMWFPRFFDALPEFNGMKMKSGTISDAKSFCGYHKSKDGNEYIFSFIVNNYNGRASALVNKMYTVLDVLK